MIRRNRNRTTFTSVAGAALLALAIANTGSVAAEGLEVAVGGRVTAGELRSTTIHVTRKADYSREALREIFLELPEPMPSRLSEVTSHNSQGPIEFYYTDRPSLETSRFAEPLVFLLEVFLGMLSLLSPTPGIPDFENAPGPPPVFLAGGGLPLTGDAVEEYSARFTMPDDLTPEEWRYHQKVLALVFAANRRENSPEYRRLANAAPNVPSRSESEDSSPPAIAAVRRGGEAEGLPPGVSSVVAPRRAPAHSDLD